MKFGEKLRAERERKRLSQVALAQAIGVSRFTLINYESGKSHPQDREIYFKLADFFEVDVNYFLTEDEEAITEAAKRYGRKGDAQAEAVLEQASALFAGGGLSEHAQSAFIREMQAIHPGCRAAGEEAKEVAHMNFIQSELERVLREYQTRDPFELLDCIGAVTRFSNEIGEEHLKGFATIIYDIPYAVISNDLSHNDKRIVAGHEASHLILHPQEILDSPLRALKDFDLYRSTDRIEYEANLFLADFLVSDEEVLDVVRGGDGDFFHTASTLYLPPELLGFKLYSLMQRGHKVRNPVNLKSDFLRG